VVSICHAIFSFSKAKIIIATTLQDVRLTLAKEEAAQVALGNLPRHKMSLSAFLIAGFELEDSQYVIWTILSDFPFNLRIDISFVARHPS